MLFVIGYEYIFMIYLLFQADMLCFIIYFICCCS